MRTPLNVINFQKDVDDICRAAAKRCFTSANDLENAIHQFRDETNPLIISLYEEYSIAFPGFIHQGDWRVGVHLRVNDGGINYTPNAQLLNFMNHLKLTETKPLKSFELFMSDNNRYIVFAYDKANAIQVMCEKHPDLTILMPESIVESEIPNKPAVFTVKSSVQF